MCTTVNICTYWPELDLEVSFFDDGFPLTTTVMLVLGFATVASDGASMTLAGTVQGKDNINIIIVFKIIYLYIYYLYIKIKTDPAYHKL